MQTLSHQLVPVRERISKLEEERQEVASERDETEATNRAEVDSLQGEEQSLLSVNREIMRLGPQQKGRGGGWSHEERAWE